MISGPHLASRPTGLPAGAGSLTRLNLLARVPAAKRPRCERLLLQAAAWCVLLLACASAALAVPEGFDEELVVSGLDRPAGMAFLPDGRLLVVELKTARVRLVVGDSLAAIDPVVTVPDVRNDFFERGLLGIVVDPGFPGRPYVYVHCNDDDALVVRVTRFTVGGDLTLTGNGSLTIDPASRHDVIASVPDNDDRHNGGTLRFGPDGMLYASFGEDHGGCAAQDTSGLRGVILRLDVSRLPPGPGGPPAPDLVTPPGNPFATGGLNARLIWAFGLRNPFRFGIDPVDGTLYIGDVGQLTWEEVDRAPVGGLDFGWSRHEGFALFNASCALTLPHTPPIHAYSRITSSASVICAGAYRAPAGAARPFPPEYEGDVFFSDYYDGFLRRLTGSGDAWAIAPPVPGQPGPDVWAAGLGAVSDYLVGPDGSLWYCRQYTNPFAPTGEIVRIVSTASTDVTGATVPPRVRFDAPCPSPARGVARLSYTLPAPAEVGLVVLDLGGRVVRRLVPPAVEAAGTRERVWDGHDDHGRAAPAGVYLAVLSVAGERLERRVALVR